MSLPITAGIDTSRAATFKRLPGVTRARVSDSREPVEALQQLSSRLKWRLTFSSAKQVHRLRP